MTDQSQDNRDSEVEIFAGLLMLDVDGSTKIYERYGDEKAKDLIGKSVGVMTAETERQGGTVIKTLGDGVLAMFPTMDGAFRTLLGVRDGHQRLAVTIHGGAHFGPVVQRDGDLYGDAVGVVEHVSEIAKQGELLISGQAREKLSENCDDILRKLDTLPGKGKAGAIDIYAVLSDDENSTVIASGIPLPISVTTTLLLSFEGREIEMKPSTSEMSIGRDPTCDVVLDSNFASRNHATIISRRGKFFLNDHSSNGTYVRRDGEAATFLKRDLLQLNQKGEISVGQDPDKNPEGLIHYQVAESE